MLDSRRCPVPPTCSADACSLAWSLATSALPSSRSRVIPAFSAEMVVTCFCRSFSWMLRRPNCEGGWGTLAGVREGGGCDEKVKALHAV